MSGENGLHQDDAQDDATHELSDESTFATDEDQEITLTFSYDPPATMDELFGIGEETLFHAFDLALARVGVMESVEVSVLITTDEGIRALNREYRGKDEPTDVLSFPLLDQPLVDAPADQLWPVGEHDAEDADDEQSDEFTDDFTDEDDESLTEMAVLIGNETSGDEASDEDEEPAFWPTHLGDIAISRETALRQARQAGHSVAYEVAFLFVHGVLHLVGFDDHTDAGYQAMVAHQEAALAEAGVTRA